MTEPRFLSSSLLALLASLALAGCPTPTSNDDDATSNDDDSTEAPVPAAPESLTAVWNDTDGSIDVAWTLPADPGSAVEVLVLVSRDGAVTDVPVGGTAYTAGDALPNGAVVGYVGVDPAWNDAAPVDQLNHFAAWGLDADAAYSAESIEAMVDGVAPAPPTALVVTYSPALGVNAGWVPSTDPDAAGTLVLGSQGLDLADVPAAGTTYSAGDVLPNGAVVVFAGQGSTAAIIDPTAGYHDFAAWAWDEAGNWSVASNRDYAYPSLFSASASVSIDATDPTNMVVTVTQQPDGWGLAASASTRPATFLLSGGDDGELYFVSTTPGPSGNDVTIGLNSGDPGTVLAISTTATDITVDYEENVHTAGQIAALINGDAAASALVTASAPIDGPRFDDAQVTLDDGDHATLRLWLDVTNNTPRPTFAAKAVVSSVSEGTAAARWEVDGSPAAGLSTRGLAVGETARMWVDITGWELATGPITVQLELRDDPVVLVSGGWDESFIAVDSSGSGMQVQVSSEETGFGMFDQDSKHRDGFITRDGSMAYLGNHNMPTVVGVDMLTFRPVVALDLDNGTGVGHVNSVVAGPHGKYAYATVTYGAHSAAWEDSGVQNLSVCGTEPCLATAEQSDLVRIQLSDFTEVDRLTLQTASQNGLRARNLSIDKAGIVGVVPMYREGALAVVDLKTMTLSSTIDLSATGMTAQEAAVSADGLTAWVAFKGYVFSDSVLPATLDTLNDGTLAMVDLATETITALAPPTVEGESRPGFLERIPSGLIVYGRKNMTSTGAVSVYDPAGATWSEYVFTPELTDANGMEYPAKGQLGYIYSKDESRIDVVDVVNGTVVRSVGGLDNTGSGHQTLVTPF